MPLPAFISFNYDRSFDTFLSDIFRLEFRREDLQINNPVLHVHGRLGYLDSDYTKQFRRPYSPHATPDEIWDSASGIRVISELGNDYGQEMNQAQEEIKKAKRVTFLGFGYDRTNLYRLLKCIEGPWQERGKFFGTAFKLGSERIAELMKQTEGRLALAESDTTIGSFLARSKVPIL